MSDFIEHTCQACTQHHLRRHTPSNPVLPVRQTHPWIDWYIIGLTHNSRRDLLHSQLNRNQFNSLQSLEPKERYWPQAIIPFRDPYTPFPYISPIQVLLRIPFRLFFYRLDSTVLRLENTRLLCKLLSHRYLPFTNAYPILRTLTPIYRSTYSEFAFFKPSWLAFTAVLHYSIFQEPCFRNVTNHGRPQSFGKLHNGWMHSTQPYSGVRLF